MKLRERRNGAILAADLGHPDVAAEEILSVVSGGVETNEAEDKLPAHAADGKEQVANIYMTSPMRTDGGLFYAI